MKKLLSMFGAIGLVATSSVTVVACGSSAKFTNQDLANMDRDVKESDLIEGINSINEYYKVNVQVNAIKIFASTDDLDKFKKLLDKNDEVDNTKTDGVTTIDKIDPKSPDCYYLAGKLSDDSKTFKALETGKITFLA